MSHPNPPTVPGRTWLPVPGFTSYLVSSDGLVWSLLSHRLLTPQLTDDGYRVVTLQGGVRRRVARLVGLAFLPRPDDQPHDLLTIDHRDARRDNDAVENLRWSTWSQQQQNTRRGGVRVLPSGRYQARVVTGESRVSLGTYATRQEAMEVYQQRCLAERGEWAPVVYNQLPEVLAARVIYTRA